MTKGTDSHSGKKVHSLGVGHALTGSGAVVYLGFLCPAGSRARLWTYTALNPDLEDSRCWQLDTRSQASQLLVSEHLKDKNQKSQYLRYSYEDNSFPFSAENMANTDISLERCQVAVVCCEVHLVSGLTKELAMPFFFF